MAATSDFDLGPLPKKVTGSCQCSRIAYKIDFPEGHDFKENISYISTQSTKIDHTYLLGLSLTRTARTAHANAPNAERAHPRFSSCISKSRTAPSPGPHRPTHSGTTIALREWLGVSAASAEPFSTGAGKSAQISASPSAPLTRFTYSVKGRKRPS